MAGRDPGEGFSDLSPGRRLCAGLLLAAGVALAGGTAHRVAIEGQDISRSVAPEPVLAAFGACFLLALGGGLLAGRFDRGGGGVRPAPPSRRRILLPCASGLATAMLFGRVWALQSRSRVPLAVLPVWGLALLCGATAFALAGRARGPEGSAARFPRGIAAALIAVVGLGAWCRLASLDAVPPAFGGDEANQVADGLELVRGGSEGDLFGTGWGGTMRLGMLPGGLGRLAWSNPIAGPRRPYAVAGTLALCATAAAGGLLAGPWGALAAAGLLAFAPHHVHFSRLASVMVLDSLLAAIFLMLALRVFQRGSPLTGFLAGAAAGLSLYGYVGGRIVPVAFLIAMPLLIAGRASRGRRALLAAALAAGFSLAAAPNLRFAARFPNEWNSRFNQTTIFRPDWWQPRLREVGSPAGVLKEQFFAGSIRLLSGPSKWSWFTGSPLVAPFFLPALAAAGAGWLLGRGRIVAALLPGLLVAGNLAAVILTDSSPAPQRLSSLFPALAVLGGAAVSGFLDLLPDRGRPESLWRTAAGTLAVGGIFFGAFRGLPPVWDPSPGYGARQAAFVRSAAEVLRAPRHRAERIYLEGLPYVDSSFPLFAYLLPATRWVNRNPERASGPFEPGLHLFAPEWLPLARRWSAQRQLSHAIALPDPADPLQDVGWLARER